MKKFLKSLTIFFLSQFFLIGCIAGPNSPSYKREISHMQDYYFTDQTGRNEKIKNQAVNDLTGCPILIRMEGWEFKTRKFKIAKILHTEQSWERPQSWMYPSGMVSETDAGIDDENFIRSKDTILIYVGPWKDIHLEYGWPWNRTKIDKKIRFTAIQKKNDVAKGYIYGSYEFMTPQNQDIPEQPITLAKDLPTPQFERLCEVKWIAKHGYNAVFDQKTAKILEANE